MYKIDSWWEVAGWHSEPSLALCDDLEGWDGVREGGSRGKGYIIIMTNSYRCMAETNTTLGKLKNKKYINGITDK